MATTYKHELSREDPPAKRQRRPQYRSSALVEGASHGRYVYDVVSVRGRGFSEIKLHRPWSIFYGIVPAFVPAFEERLSSKRPTATLADPRNPRVVEMNIEGVGPVLVGERTFTYANIAAATCTDVMALVQDYIGDGCHEFGEAVASLRAAKKVEGAKELEAELNGNFYSREELDYSELRHKFHLQMMDGMSANMLGYMEENHQYDPDTVYASVRLLDPTAVNHNIMAVVTRECPHTGGRSYRLDSLTNPSFWSEVTTAPVRLA